MMTTPDDSSAMVTMHQLEPKAILQAIRVNNSMHCSVKSVCTIQAVTAFAEQAEQQRHNMLKPVMPLNWGTRPVTDSPLHA